MDGDALKYPRGKDEVKLQRVELAEGGIVPLHSHTITLLGNVEQGTIVIKRQRIEDLIYKEGYISKLVRRHQNVKWVLPKIITQ